MLLSAQPQGENNEVNRNNNLGDEAQISPDVVHADINGIITDVQHGRANTEVTSGETIKIGNVSIVRNTDNNTERPIDTDDLRIVKETFITVSDENGSIPVNNLLPPGWKLLEVQGQSHFLGVDKIKKEIYIPQYWAISNRSSDEFVDNPDAFVSRRTMGGSSRNRGKKEMTRYEEIYKFLGTYNGLIFVLHEIGHSYSDAEGNQPAGEGNDMYFAARQLLNDTPISELSERELEMYQKHVIDEERRAWFYALRLLRRVKSENGVDLSAGKSNKQILQTVSTALEKIGEKEIKDCLRLKRAA